MIVVASLPRGEAAIIDSQLNVATEAMPQDSREFESVFVDAPPRSREAATFTRSLPEFCMSEANNAQRVIVVLMLTISSTVWWMWWRRRKRFGFVWQPHATASPVWNLAAVVLALALIGLHLLVGLMPDSGESKPITLEHVRFGCLERAVLVAMLVGLLTGFGARSVRDFGITLENWRQQIQVGLETAHASFLPVLTLMMATLLLRRPDEKNALLRLLDQDRSFATLTWVLLAAVVFAPLIEELLFRVILLGWLKTKTTAAHAIGLSSLAFAFIHGPLDGAALLPLALLLGSLYDRQQRYLSVVVAHAFFNLWNIALTLAV